MNHSARKDEIVRNQPNREKKFNCLPKRRGLTSLCAECILKNVDVNKRIQLSMSYPSIRGIEKSAPLEIGKLIITHSNLNINDTKYEFGEILQIPENSSFDEKQIEAINAMNLDGGFQWRSLKNEIVAPGDVELRNRDDSFLESQKNEIVEELRRTFMRALEMYLNGKEELNPMEMLNVLEKESDEEAFDRQARNMFEILGETSGSLDKIYSMRDFFYIVKNGRSGQVDRLSEEYPSG